MSGQLSGRSALVTGSTSGIGLGIARALAARRRQPHAERLRRAGGDRADPRRAGRGERRHGAPFRRRHEPGRRDRPDGARGRGRVRRARHPGQQRRHPARRADRGVSPGQVGRDPRDQPVARLPHDPPRAARDAAAGLRPDHQPGLGARPGRLALQGGLRRGQARHGRADQGRGARDRAGRTSPATRSARASSRPLWSRGRSTSRPRRTTCRASR